MTATLIMTEKEATIDMIVKMTEIIPRRVLEWRHQLRRHQSPLIETSR